MTIRTPCAKVPPAARHPLQHNPEDSSTMPEPFAPYVEASPVPELPPSCRPLLDELVDRLLAIGHVHAHDRATYLDGTRTAVVARLDAAAIVHCLRARLDELAPEVGFLREAVREANRERDGAVRDCTVLRDARDNLAEALVAERRLNGAHATDALLADARRHTVTSYLRRDADTTTTLATLRERMRWAADMLNAADDEGVAL